MVQAIRHTQQIDLKLVAVTVYVVMSVSQCSLNPESPSFQDSKLQLVVQHLEGWVGWKVNTVEASMTPANNTASNHNPS